ncbi:hypothetical protein [Candidatus Chlorohelix sp.]|uniref:hypothetical protein n=1 Tax=Candidatus Chlorohelix sp. TaxID=3139201 RepID=UPI0030574E96
MIDRILKAIIILSILGIVFILLYSGASAARQTVFTANYNLSSSDVIFYDDPDRARQFVSELVSGKAQFYSFTASKGLAIDLELNIPRLEGLENFRPSLALFGNDLPKPPESALRKLPFTLPTEYGIVLSQDDPNEPKTRVLVDEPYTQTGFWEGQRIGRELTQATTYYVAVFDPEAHSGKYVLLTGNRNGASLADTLTFPWLWVQLQFWYEQGLIAILVILVLVTGFVTLSYFSFIRHKKKPSH